MALISSDVYTPTRAVASTVRNLRQQRGVSAQQLAQRCAQLGVPGLNRSVIANLESGRRSFVTIEELYALALALGVPPRALLFPPGADRVQVAPACSATNEPSVREWFDGGTLLDPLEIGKDPEWSLRALPAEERQRLSARLHPAVRAVDEVERATIAAVDRAAIVAVDRKMRDRKMPIARKSQDLMARRLRQARQKADAYLDLLLAELDEELAILEDEENGD